MHVAPLTWVVYLMTVPRRTDGVKAVCKQSEWDAMERARPGYHQLLRGGIATEVEAEMLARLPSAVASCAPSELEVPIKPGAVDH
jgi:hypothetical protein